MLVIVGNACSIHSYVYECIQKKINLLRASEEKGG